MSLTKGQVLLGFKAWPVWALWAALALPGRAAKTCYDVHGNVQNNYSPCLPDALQSSCCSTADLCLSNGLCFNTGADNLYAQGGCTDSSFAAEACRKACPNLTSGFSYDIFPCHASNSVQVTYCCGPTSNCCTDGSAFVTFPVGHPIIRASDTGIIFPSSATATGSSSTTGAGSRSTTATGGSTGPTETVVQSKSSNSKSLAIGLGVGIPLGILLLAAVAIIIILLRRQKGAGEKAQAPTTGYTVAEVHGDQYYPEGHGTRPVEAPYWTQQGYDRQA